MNEGKMIEVLSAIERSDGTVTHDQDTWYTKTSGCGTTACVAGWVALLDGWTPLVVESSGEADFAVKGRSDPTHIAAIASSVLELDTRTAHRMFYICDTLSEIYSLAAREMGVDVQVLRDKVKGSGS